MAGPQRRAAAGGGQGQAASTAATLAAEPKAAPKALLGYYFMLKLVPWRDRVLAPTAISSVSAAAVLAVMAAWSVVVAWLRLRPRTAALLLPFPALSAALAARVLRGMPATLRGALPGEKTRLHPDYEGKRYALVGMPISNFVEKLRWVMDLLDAPYEEHDVGGLLSVYLRGRSVPWLLDRQACSSIGNSDEAIAYVGAVHVPTMPEPLRGRAEALLRRTDASRAWEDRLNAAGHALQGWAYAQVLRDGYRDLCLVIWGQREAKVPVVDRLLLLLLFPVLRGLMREVFRISDAELAEERRNTLMDLIVEADKALADGRPHLLGAELSYVDIAFATMLTPILGRTVSFASPRSLYARGRFSSFDSVAERLAAAGLYPKELDDLEAEIMSHPGGQYIKRLYERRCDTLQAFTP